MTLESGWDHEIVSGLKRELATLNAMRNDFDRLRRMTPEERVTISFQLRRVVLGFCRAGVRRRHPGFSEAEVEREVQRRFLPPDIFARLFPA